MPVRATARLQLHRDFPFAAAAARVPYLHALGVSHIYASPILTARRGSAHGYDVVDHRAVNPELGGEDGLRALVATLRARGMGLIADIVPNHMAVGGDDNAWWLDLLEWGRDSPFARFFDIDWDVPDPALRGRVLAPFLGRPYGEALAAGEIALEFDAAAGRFHARYFEHRFPLAPRTCETLLGAPALADLRGRLRTLPRGTAAARAAFDDIARELARRAAEPAAAAALGEGLAHHAPDTPAGRLRLHRLLERQHFRLAWWCTARDEINWRRFFDLAGYAGLRVEEPAVFEAVHATIFRLYAEGLLDGVRVDHVDGLADPRAYCRKLRTRLAQLAERRPEGLREPAYIVVEKILAPGERLPRDWRVDGATGYSFMNDVGALLHDPRGEAPLTRAWTTLTGRAADFAAEERQARRRLADELLSADLGAAALALHRIARADPATRDITLAAIHRVLLELLVHFPVYRVYTDRNGRDPADEAVMARVREAARPACRPAERYLVDVLDRWLGGEAPAHAPSKAARALRLRAITRFHQLSSPLAAKAVEDTAFYRHGKLLSRNEVGADPGQFALDVDGFHAQVLQRARHFPQALLATATHDHKRGEDARARLAVLSEIAERWSAQAAGWSALNAPLRVRRPAGEAPAPADEYMLYQTLAGHWPPTLAAADAPGLRDFRERVAAWHVKAVREAKLRSSWLEPDTGYEEDCCAFLDALLDPERSADFLASLRAFVDSIAPAGAANALAQTLLRLTLPGMPDLYQGTEFWDFSLVDPDNRRPVDYDARERTLAAADDPLALLKDWRDGRIKQRLVATALRLRAAHPDLFIGGAYLPLTVQGPARAHAVAFARGAGAKALLVIAARWSAHRTEPDRPRVPPERWDGTTLLLPAALARRHWTNALTGRPLDPGGRLALGPALDGWPLALLLSRERDEGWAVQPLSGVSARRG